MPAFRQSAHQFVVLLTLLMSLVMAAPVSAQNVPGQRNNIEAELVAEQGAKPGETVTMAIRFRPVDPAWHGYWKNPGDAGYGMVLDWHLPAGWTAGVPQYPVPKRLVISDLMNHIYEGEYAVLVPLTVPASADPAGIVELAVDAQWLACTNEICVPERARLQFALAMGKGEIADARFAGWRAAIPAMIDSHGRYEVAGNRLRMAIPVPAALEISDPHVFVANTDLVRYAPRQIFRREGNTLVAEIQLSHPGADPAQIEAILSFGGGEGIQFVAEPGEVPAGGALLSGTPAGTPALGWLLLAALAGGLILNVMPCVFPILSLKALSLARAGGSEAEARKEGLAYTAGVVSACVALGAVMLALRAAGQQIGWAFQLQEPGVVVALLALAVAITANLAGVFELPSVPLTRTGEPASAFATGLLAAIAATPCTGPFMAAAVGAALLLPAYQALLLFAVLGLGLALPFLLIGFVPALRKILPQPGPWMGRFRRLMAIPMGLTALALVWLVARLGGQHFALMALMLVLGLFVALAVVGRLQAAGKIAWPVFGLIFAPFAVFAAFALPASYSRAAPESGSSLLDPVPYSAEALAQARAAGKPVFVWFTADWCLTCKVTEGVAIEREETRAAFESAGVVAMRGDWTRRDPAITEYLTGQGAAGVPLYVWYGPGGEAEKLPQILSPDSLVELAKRARGSRRGTAQSAGPGAGLN